MGYPCGELICGGGDCDEDSGSDGEASGEGVDAPHGVSATHAVCV